jgi:hypothetical protein
MERNASSIKDNVSLGVQLEAVSFNRNCIMEIAKIVQMV